MNSIVYRTHLGRLLCPKGPLFNYFQGIYHFPGKLGNAPACSLGHCLFPLVGHCLFPLADPLTDAGTDTAADTDTDADADTTADKVTFGVIPANGKVPIGPAQGLIGSLVGE